MQTTNVHIFEINVIFDPQAVDKVSLTGDVSFMTEGTKVKTVIGNPPGIPQGIHLIRFRLLSDVQGAVFPSSPIEWLSDDGANARPPELPLQWQTPKQFGTVVFNAVGLPKSYHFSVVVALDGDLFSTDPTIICDPPGVPPP